MNYDSSSNGELLFNGKILEINPVFKTKNNFHNEIWASEFKNAFETKPPNFNLHSELKSANAFIKAKPPGHPSHKLGTFGSDGNPTVTPPGSQGSEAGAKIGHHFVSPKLEAALWHQLTTAASSAR